MCHAARLASLSLAALALAPALASQTVLVVDLANGPGTDFENLSDAIAAASSGDILLIRDGFYNGVFVSIDGKALTLVGEADDAAIRGQIVVTNLPAGETFTLANLTLRDPFNTAETFVFSGNAGTVWVDDVVIEGSSVAVFTSADQVLVTDCPSVVFTGVVAEGGDQAAGPGLGGAAVRVTDSNVHLYDCALVGGRGGSSDSTAGEGGPGLYVRGDSFVYAQSSSLSGGQGGQVGTLFGCVGAQAGEGGVGVHLDGPASPDVRLLDVALAGGPGGVPMNPPGTCTNGDPGTESRVDAGSLVAFVHPAHGLAITNPVRADESVSLTFSGLPGETVWYVFSGGASSFFFAGLLGTLVLDFPLYVIPAGTLGAGGTLDVSATPPLTPGFDGQVFYLQALFFDATLGFTLSDAGTLTVLDPSL